MLGIEHVIAPGLIAKSSSDTNEDDDSQLITNVSAMWKIRTNHCEDLNKNDGQPPFTNSGHHVRRSLSSF